MVIIDRNDGKAAVVAGVIDDLKGRINAVEFVRTAATALGGKGGDPDATRPCAKRLRKWRGDWAVKKGL